MDMLTFFLYSFFLNMCDLVEEFVQLCEIQGFEEYGINDYLRTYIIWG